MLIFKAFKNAFFLLACLFWKFASTLPVTKGRVGRIKFQSQMMMATVSDSVRCFCLLMLILCVGAPKSKSHRNGYDHVQYIEFVIAL